MPVRPMAARRLPSSGFTLVELLITAVLGSVVIGSLAAYSLSQLRSDANQELNLQLRLEANRAAGWIDSEFNRASGFTSTAVTDCSVPAGTSAVVSMGIPGTAGSVVTFYSPTGTTLGNVARCGRPVVCTSGAACELDPTGAVTTYLIASNARLTVTPAPTATPVRALTYTLTLGNGAITSVINRPAVAGAPSYD